MREQDIIHRKRALTRTTKNEVEQTRNNAKEDRRTFDTEKTSAAHEKDDPDTKKTIQQLRSKRSHTTTTELEQLLQAIEIPARSMRDIPMVAKMSLSSSVAEALTPVAPSKIFEQEQENGMNSLCAMEWIPYSGINSNYQTPGLFAWIKEELNDITRRALHRAKSQLQNEELITTFDYVLSS